MSKDRFTPGVHSRAATAGLWILAGAAFCLCGCGSSSTSGKPGTSANATPPTAAVAGYIWDSRTQGLRPVSGSLGAARLESPLPGLGLRSATPCASRGFALGADAGGHVLAIDLSSGQPTKLGDPVAVDQQIILSPTCVNGLVYSPSHASGLLITGLPSSPRVQSIAISPSGPLISAAIADTGSILFATATPGGTASLQILPASGAPQALSTLQTVSGLAFLSGTDSAIIADSAANTIYLGKQLSSSPSISPLAASAQGVSSPRAVAASADAHFAFIANGAGNSLLRIDLTSATAPLRLACGCSPTELLPLAGNAGFQITDPAAGMIFALSGDGQTPRTVFIPTDKGIAAAGGAQ